MSRVIVDIPNLRKVKIEKNLVSLLLAHRNNQPVIVLVSMNNCVPCTQMKPQFIDYAKRTIGKVFCIYVCIDDFDNKMDLIRQVDNKFPSFIITFRGHSAIIKGSLEKMEEAVTNMLNDPLLRIPAAQSSSQSSQLPNQSSQVVCVDGVCSLPSKNTTNNTMVQNSEYEPNKNINKHSDKKNKHISRKSKHSHKKNKHSDNTNKHSNKKKHHHGSVINKNHKLSTLVTSDTEETSSDNKLYNKNSDEDSDSNDDLSDDNLSSDSSISSIDTAEFMKKLKSQTTTVSELVPPAIPLEYQSRLNTINHMRQNIAFWRNQPNQNSETLATLAQQQNYLQACENKLQVDMGKDERTRMIMEMQAKQNAVIQEEQKRNAMIQQQQALMNGMFMQNPAYMQQAAQNGQYNPAMALGQQPNNMQRPPQMMPMNQQPNNMQRPPQMMNQQPNNMQRPPQMMNQQPNNMQRPPQMMNNISQQNTFQQSQMMPNQQQMSTRIAPQQMENNRQMAPQQSSYQETRRQPPPRQMRN
jgi:hypothetical protein